MRTKRDSSIKNDDVIQNLKLTFTKIASIETIVYISIFIAIFL